MESIRSAITALIAERVDLLPHIAHRPLDDPRPAPVGARPVGHHHVAGVLLHRGSQQQRQLLRDRDGLVAAVGLQVIAGPLLPGMHHAPYEVHIGYPQARRFRDP